MDKLAQTEVCFGHAIRGGKVIAYIGDTESEVTSKPQQKKREILTLKKKPVHGCTSVRIQAEMPNDVRHHNNKQIISQRPSVVESSTFAEQQFALRRHHAEHGPARNNTIYCCGRKGRTG